MRQNKKINKGKDVVAIFITCLVDIFRPSVGFATVKLIESAGYKVEVPAVQTCCGQPAYNSGDFKGAREIASNIIDTFSGYEIIVVPSGSCTGMMVKHFKELFKNDQDMYRLADDFSKKTYELVSFLSTQKRKKLLDVSFNETITYHDSCSSLREIGIKKEARQLLQEVRGLKIKELAFNDVCCGFGGTFCVKYPEISENMVKEQLADAASTKAKTLLSADMGCLMNIAGRAIKEGRDLSCRHIAEVLAGNTEEAPIGKTSSNE